MRLAWGGVLVAAWVLAGCAADNGGVSEADMQSSQQQAQAAAAQSGWTPEMVQRFQEVKQAEDAGQPLTGAAPGVSPGVPAGGGGQAVTPGYGAPTVSGAPSGMGGSAPGGSGASAQQGGSWGDASAGGSGIAGDSK